MVEPRSKRPRIFHNANNFPLFQLFAIIKSDFKTIRIMQTKKSVLKQILSCIWAEITLTSNCTQKFTDTSLLSVKNEEIYIYMKTSESEYTSSRINKNSIKILSIRRNHIPLDIVQFVRKSNCFYYAKVEAQNQRPHVDTVIK